jgi:hypothetical protein
LGWGFAALVRAGCLLGWRTAWKRALMLSSVACSEPAGAAGWLIAANSAWSEPAGTAGVPGWGATEVFGA